MIEVLEHTADVGLRVRAGDLNSLFAEAARGVSTLLVDNLEEAQATQKLRVELAADSLEDLFVDWLRELLYLHETRHLVLCHFEVQLKGTSLSAEVGGEPIDPRRHQVSREIKAITYHGLSLVQTERDWVAELIVDI